MRFVARCDNLEESKRKRPVLVTLAPKLDLLAEGDIPPYYPGVSEMSFDMVNEVIKKSNITAHAEQLLLIYLAYYENPKTGLCCPSERTLSQRLYITPKHLQRLIRNLIAQGVLLVKRAAHPRKTTFYKVVMPDHGQIACQERIEPIDDEVFERQKTASKCAKTVLKMRQKSRQNAPGNPRSAHKHYTNGYPNKYWNKDLNKEEDGAFGSSVSKGSARARQEASKTPKSQDPSSSYKNLGTQKAKIPETQERKLPPSERCPKCHDYAHETKTCLCHKCRMVVCICCPDCHELPEDCRCGQVARETEPVYGPLALVPLAGAGD